MVDFLLKSIGSHVGIGEYFLTSFFYSIHELSLDYNGRI